MSETERSQAETAHSVSLPGSSQFDLQDVVCGGRHTLLMTGELDMASAPALREALGEVCTDATTAVVLDLRNLTFMDSTGIHAVLVAKELCSTCGCDFLVIPGRASVLRVLAVSGLLDALPFEGDESDVASALSGNDSHTGSPS